MKGFLFELRDRLIQALDHADEMVDIEDEVWLLRRSIQVILEEIDEEILSGIE